MATLITLVDATVPVAADFNTNFVNLNNEVRPVPQGGSGAATFTANGVLYGNGTAAFSATTTGSAGQVMRIANAGGAPVFGGGTVVLDRDVVSATVANTTGAVGIYSFSVPGGMLGSDRALRLTAFGDYSNSNGTTASSLTLNMVYGTATFLVMPSSAVPATTAGARAVIIEALLAAANTTSSQNAVGRVVVGGIASSTGTAAAAILDTLLAVNSAVSVDSSAAQTISMTVAHQVANANTSFIMRDVYLELVGS